MSNKNKQQLKARTFLYDQVTAHFYPHRNIRMDNAADELEAQLVKALGKKEKDLENDSNPYGTFCLLLTYTKKLEFNWLPDAPEAWLLFQELWQAWIKGRPVVEVWEMLTSEAFDMIALYGWNATDEQKEDGIVDVVGWAEAWRLAMIPWSPMTQRPAAQVPAPEAADPN